MKKYASMAGLILVTVIWGGGFVASDLALEGMTPFQILAVRFGIAAILLGLLGVGKLRKVSKKEILAGIFMGTALYLGFALQIVGLSYTTPSRNAFLTATNVVMVPFLAWIFSKKKIGVRGMLGAVMALVGVGVLSLDSGFSIGIGDALTLGCAVAFAFQIYLTGVFVQRYRSEILNMVQMATAFLLSVICLWIQRDFLFSADQTSWLSVLYLGVVSTTVCYLLQTVCQRYVEETKAAVILSMESVFGTLFSILILQERVTGRMAAGCVVILAGVLVSTLEPQDKPEQNLMEIHTGERR